MNLTIYPNKLGGTVSAIASKSQAHRLLICAAFSDKETVLECAQTSRDIEATVKCLRALGSTITHTETGYRVIPVSKIPTQAVLDCEESGSTLRFMLPIAGALGVDTVFQMTGKLPERPISPLLNEMERMGCRLTRLKKGTIRCQSKLRNGQYTICGSISSQFITGLLYALALIEGSSELQITGELGSAPYICMTQQALSVFGVDTSDYRVTGSFPFRSPGRVTVEGDWSNAAFFLAAYAIGNDVQVENLSDDASQGDRVITYLLKSIEQQCTIDVANTPDLLPVLAVVAARKSGAVFENIQRLRFKESDRVAAVLSMLSALGISAYADETTLTVVPGSFKGGVIDSFNDHRIAMAAAIAATAADAPVTILNAQCVAKSYPDFWLDYKKLGGIYEQYIW